MAIMRALGRKLTGVPLSKSTERPEVSFLLQILRSYTMEVSLGNVMPTSVKIPYNL
jgi:hypothetical protein